MPTNKNRRNLLRRVRETGYPGSITEVFQAADQGLDLISQFQEEQQQTQVAQTPQQQETGLREEHARGNTQASMAFPDVQPNQSFNTVGMKAPIDIQKVNDQGHLVESYKNVPPGIQNLPTGPYEGTVIESPPAYQKGGFDFYSTPVAQSDATRVNQYNPNLEISTTPDPTFLEKITDPIRKNIAENLYPESYAEPVKRVWNAARGKKSSMYEARYPDGFKQLYSETDRVKERIDLLHMAMGQDQKYNTVKKSEYKPTKAKDSNVQYYTSPQTEAQLRKYMARDRFFDRSNRTGFGSPTLGEFTYDSGEDEKGTYVSYYDKWDLNPLDHMFGNKKINKLVDRVTNAVGITPPEIYGRIYDKDLTDIPRATESFEKTKIKKQKGGYRQKYQKGGLNIGAEISPEIVPGNFCGSVTGCGQGKSPFSVIPSIEASYNTNSKNINTGYGGGIGFNTSPSSGGFESILSYKRRNAFDTQGYDAVTPIGKGTDNISLSLGKGRRGRSSNVSWRSDSAPYRYGINTEYDLTNKKLSNIGLYGQYGKFKGSLGYSPMTKGVSVGAGFKFQKGGFDYGNIPRSPGLTISEEDQRGEFYQSPTIGEKINRYFQDPEGFSRFMTPQSPGEALLYTAPLGIIASKFPWLKNLVKGKKYPKPNIKVTQQTKIKGKTKGGQEIIGSTEFKINAKTIKDVESNIKKRVDYVKSKEYLNLRHANSGESKAQIKAAVDRYVRELEGSTIRFVPRSSLGTGTSGRYVKKGEIKIGYGKGESGGNINWNTIDHELGHLLSPTGKKIPGFPKKGTKEYKEALLRGERNLEGGTTTSVSGKDTKLVKHGAYKNYPTLPVSESYKNVPYQGGTMHSYLSDVAEQQVRLVRAKEWMKIHHGYKGGKISDDLLDKLATDIKFTNKIPGKGIYKDFASLLAQVEGAPTGSAVWKKMVKPVLEKAWGIVPVAATGQYHYSKSGKGFNFNKTNEY